jgi:hypothetical protein
MAHATEAQLVAWLPDGTAPTGAEATRLLARASQLVDDHVLSGYAVDEFGKPSLLEVRDALRDATCAQVEEWLEVGEENDTAGYPAATSISGTGLSVTHMPAVLAPRARRALRVAGLMRGRAW